MAIVQINPPGMASTEPGYISSVTVRVNGTPTALVPNAISGQITVADAQAATNLVRDTSARKLIQG